MIDELRKLEPYSPRWLRVRTRFARDDPEGYRRWLDEERERDHHAGAAAYVGWLEESWTPFWERFHQVSRRYPRTVTEAYGGDLGRAMSESDEQVAATVAAWEREQGFSPVDWHAIGAHERNVDDKETQP